MKIIPKLCAQIVMQRKLETEKNFFRFRLFSFNRWCNTIQDNVFKTLTKLYFLMKFKIINNEEVILKANLEANNYICPLCGDFPTEKQHLGDRIRSIGASGGHETTGSGGGNLGITPNRRPENFYDCNGCTMRYVDISNFDVQIILQYLRIDPSVTEQFHYYYDKKLTVEELIENHRTGIVRKPRHVFSLISRSLFKSKMYMGFLFEGRRTIGTFVKIKENNINHYMLTRIGVP